MEMFTDYDQHNEKVGYYEKQALEYAKNTYWETDGGYVKGDKLIENLMTVPSVGIVTALLWLAEIVTPLRFKTAPQLAAYCGCDPSLKVSAGVVTSHTRRKGNAKLHHQLMMAAAVCINRHSEPFGLWGTAIHRKHAKGGFKKASGAVSRRIAVSMYYVHKLNVPFSYDKYNFYKFDVPDVSIANMGLSKRVANLFLANGLTDSKSIAQSYIVGNIYDIQGFGKKAAQEVSFWIQVNKNKKNSEVSL
jgi:hypothetical protein